MSALFPNVPIAQGVPAVARSVLFPADNSTQPPLMSSGAEVNADTARQWGLFTQAGEFAAPADNVLLFENQLEARISDYPVEQGGFGSYNKVIMPYEIRLVMSRGGSVEDRQEFFKILSDAQQSTELFNVVTPECVYLDVNVVTLRRMSEADRGATLMVLEVGLRKVRQTAKLSFTNTKDAASAGQVKNGAVQAQPTERAELQPS